jgi:hypothetical protein
MLARHQPRWSVPYVPLACRRACRATLDGIFAIISIGALGTTRPVIV